MRKLKTKVNPFTHKRERFVRYLEVKNKREPVVYQVSKIRYRDSKGRLSKFVKGKKLSVEILAKKTVFDKKQDKWVQVDRVIKKHGLRLAKRKRSVTIAKTNKRLLRKADKHKHKLGVIMDGGIVRFISP